MNREAKGLEKKILSFLQQIVITEINNPSLIGIVIDKVEISNDNSFLKIFLSSETTDKQLRTFKKTIPFLRKEISKNWTHRRLPELKVVRSLGDNDVSNVLNILDKLKENE